MDEGSEWQPHNRGRTNPLWRQQSEPLVVTYPIRLEYVSKSTENFEVHGGKVPLRNFSVEEKY